MAAGDAGPSGVWQTIDGDRALCGVVVTARSDGRFDVDLHLVAAWPTPPLHEVSSAIQDDLGSAADDAGLGERLGELSVTFGDLQGPPSTGEVS